MKTIINQVTCGIIIASTLIGCGTQDSESGNLKVEEGIDIRKNPIGAVNKIVQLSKNADKISQEVINQEPVPPISFQELIEYLPSTPAGWSAETPKGQMNSFGEYSISQVNQTFTNGDKEIEISIFDWAFNSALYAPFLMTTEFSHESTEGYNKGLKINDIPGREEYTYASKEGSLNLLVNSRFFVQIAGNNIEEEELREWWQKIDYQSLNKINK